MRWMIGIAGLAAIAVAAPAGAEMTAGALTIEPGQQIVARVADGRLVEVSRQATPQEETRVEADTVRFALASVGGQTILSVQNGYSQSFEYHADMFVGRRSAPTSTCTVLPGITGFEQWPHPIERIDLSRPTLSDGRAVQCR